MYGIRVKCQGSVCTAFIGEEAEECSAMCTVLPTDRIRVPLSLTARLPMLSEGMSQPSSNGHRD
jgi:hypothetical protein